MKSPCSRNYLLRSCVLNIVAVLCLLVSAVYPARSQSSAACGAGWCNVVMQPVQYLPGASFDLLNDIAAQYPAYNGNVSQVPLTVAGQSILPTLQAGIKEGFVTDGQVGARFTLTASASPNTNPAWVQIIDTNVNRVGYSDDPSPMHTTGTGPGIQQVNVDSTSSTDPKYTNGISAPPNFQDAPSRDAPTAANPSVKWSAELYLTSDDTVAHSLDVYRGVSWGWDAFYTPAPIVKTITDTLTDAVMVNEFLNTTTASGVYGVATLSNGQIYLFGDLIVNEDAQGQQYQYNFDYACDSLAPQCGVEPVPSQISSNFNVSLDIDSFALQGSSSLVPVSFRDFAYESTGNGTLAQTTDFPSSPPISNTPLPSTWALMLCGLGIVGFVGYRKRTAPSVTFYTAK